MTTLLDAMKALDERKGAVFGTDSDGKHITIDEARLLLLGFDLDPEELRACAHIAGESMAEAIMAGECGAGTALIAGWIDGVETGLMLAELRRQAVTA